MFPNAKVLVCTWHINKNIAANCKRYFKTQTDWDQFLREWNACVHSPTETDWNTSWKRLQQRYKQRYPKAIAYIVKNWIPWVEYFVHAWTNQVRHYRSTTTTRVEGAHAVLKHFLRTSVANLKVVYDRIKRLFADQDREIIAAIEHDRSFQLASMKDGSTEGGQAWAPVVRQISLYALKKALQELRKLFRGFRSERPHRSQTIAPRTPCTHEFSQTMGIPCSHELYSIIFQEGRALQLEDFSQQWWLNRKPIPAVSVMENGLGQAIHAFCDRYEQWPLAQQENALRQLQELGHQPPILFQHPRVCTNSKGRPVGSTELQTRTREAAKSTRRNRSQFEIEEEHLNRERRVRRRKQ